MIKTATWYNFGAVLLFLGLVWTFLPHEIHALLLNETGETSHIVHIVQGMVVALVGLGLMIIKSRSS